MTTYKRETYLKIREDIPRINHKCGICGKKLERFGERRQTYFCSDKCAEEHKKRYKKQWEKEHIENVKKAKHKYYLKQKNANKKNNTGKLQKVLKPSV